MNRHERRAAAGGLLNTEIVGPAGLAGLTRRAEAGDEAAEHLLHWVARAEGRAEGNPIGCGCCGQQVSSAIGFVACISAPANDTMAGCLICLRCAGRPPSWPAKARAALTRIMGAARADDLPGHAGGRA